MQLSLSPTSKQILGPYKQPEHPENIFQRDDFHKTPLYWLCLNRTQVFDVFMRQYLLKQQHINGRQKQNSVGLNFLSDGIFLCCFFF